MQALEYFAADTRNHELSILRDEGTNRHLRVKDPATNFDSFDVVTWPGHLCLTGDTGTYVFSRDLDMLRFFRKSRGEDGHFQVPYSYWAEKCLAQDVHGGITEFDEEQFREAVRRQRRQIIRDYGREMTKEDRKELWEELENEVLAAADEGEAACIIAVHNWSFTPHRGKESVSLDTEDWSEFKRSTSQFIWICQALALTVELYDKAKQEAKPS